ncbi:hypothetical protein MHM84_09185 [Halomonas sp. McH1-25]|uniref:hypothetical protein n=1 Tax=unclassified Halomonas TaxID=2609666 RepID=UPI001EF6FAA9|nr:MULTISPECIES: hypothetical protein [unclassified Halomonas]MCG7599961.1 hypothetical protein [Halomonas sp. McH1-25]MCP1343372.1 hypothetical protein [Halomonas sp. FL8]MCP1360471.1 hypothetical protein [Halomonas sp. BBD45]MCP1363853.1 hypothetical protein [Halomonas sp. BBD48]
MLKGIVFCFVFLAAQLFLLAHIDHRLNRSRSEITYQSHNLPAQNRQRLPTDKTNSDGTLPS